MTVKPLRHCFFWLTSKRLLLRIGCLVVVNSVMWAVVRILVEEIGSVTSVINEIQMELAEKNRIRNWAILDKENLLAQLVKKKTLQHLLLRLRYGAKQFPASMLQVNCSFANSDTHTEIQCSFENRWCAGACMYAVKLTWKIKPKARILSNH